MNKKDKGKFIISTLDNLYPKVEPPLHFENNFTFLISVLLSAQSTDERVNKTTPPLYSLANSPEKMLQIPETKIREIIKPIGLSATKAKNILLLSQRLVEDFNGEVPNTFEALESLPGVGHKTASVVMAQVFNVPAFPVDTHIHRLLFRWGISEGKNVIQTEKDGKQFFPKDKWNKLHLQIIFYGREYSPARGWILENDIITKTIGRKAIIKKYVEDLKSKQK